MMILLKYLPCFCFIADNAQEVIEAVLMPSFVHQDFKVRARSLSGLESIAETFFAIYDDISPFRKLASDPNWSVRYSFSINSSLYIRVIWNMIFNGLNNLYLYRNNKFVYFEIHFRS